jgi:hypothetical protein
LESGKANRKIGCGFFVVLPSEGDNESSGPIVSRRPLVIFLDLNLPSQSVRLFEKPWMDEINKALDRVEQKSGGKTGFNLVVLSNMPFYYNESDKPSPKGDILSIFAKNPLISVSHPEALHAIHDAANKFGHIPNDFDG